jgi:hypothetical protein
MERKMWIVMTSSAAMPSSCKGTYRNVALVQLTQEYAANGWEPKMISSRARGVLRIGQIWTRLSVGKSLRAAYNARLDWAEKEAVKLNNSHPDALAEHMLTWGGSA